MAIALQYQKRNFVVVLKENSVNPVEMLLSCDTLSDPIWFRLSPFLTALKLLQKTSTLSLCPLSVTFEAID
jgi:hypothetical protein